MRQFWKLKTVWPKKNKQYQIVFDTVKNNKTHNNKNTKKNLFDNHLTFFFLADWNACWCVVIILFWSRRDIRLVLKWMIRCRAAPSKPMTKGMQVRRRATIITNCLKNPSDCGFITEQQDFPRDHLKWYLRSQKISPFLFFVPPILFFQHTRGSATARR